MTAAMTATTTTSEVLTVVSEPKRYCESTPEPRPEMPAMRTPVASPP